MTNHLDGAAMSILPDGNTVAEVLEEMQKAHVQLSMVIDEYGGCRYGTVETYLRRCREIEDEDIGGEELEEIVEKDKGLNEVLGSTEIGKFERPRQGNRADDLRLSPTVITNQVKCATGEHLTFRGLRLTSWKQITEIGVRVKTCCRSNANE